MHPCLRKLKPGDTIIGDSHNYYFTRFTGKEDRYIVVRRLGSLAESIFNPDFCAEIKIIKGYEKEITTGTG